MGTRSCFIARLLAWGMRRARQRSVAWRISVSRLSRKPMVTCTPSRASTAKALSSLCRAMQERARRQARCMGARSCRAAGSPAGAFGAGGFRSQVTIAAAPPKVITSWARAADCQARKPSTETRSSASWGLYCFRVRPSCSASQRPFTCSGAGPALARRRTSQPFSRSVAMSRCRTSWLPDGTRLGRGGPAAAQRLSSASSSSRRPCVR
mmetsp:Transcript_93429/g.264516  ORF Transcript_93429/g.264516 Transcript_93429/m.264516 type:complete len:209 (-) Transcript_93429:1521-2147(-)